MEQGALLAMRNTLLDAALRDRDFERCVELTSPGWAQRLVITPIPSLLPSNKMILSVGGKIAATYLEDSAVTTVFIIDKDEEDFDWESEGLSFRQLMGQLGEVKWLDLDRSLYDFYRTGFRVMHPKELFFIASSFMGQR